MLCLAQFPRPVRAAIRLLWGVGIVGVALFAAGAVVGYGRPPPDAVEAFYTALYLVPAALCLVRAVVVREERTAWAAFGVGMLCWAAGYGHYFVVLEKLESPPYPSLSDALWLGYYVGVMVGLLALMTKGRISPVDFEQRVMALLGRLTRDRATQRCDEPEAQPVGG